MSIVSDASLFVNLARIGQLDLLPRVVGPVLVPEAVWEEVVVLGVGRPGSQEVAAADWIERRSIHDRRLALALQRDLGAGEAEAIVLALEASADALLIDDRLGRIAATRLGLTCVGLVGVLVEARNLGCISTLRPFLDALRSAGFRISERLYRRVLADWGEAAEPE